MLSRFVLGGSMPFDFNAAVMTDCVTNAHVIPSVEQCQIPGVGLACA